jgi:hypothetical protein
VKRFLHLGEYDCINIPQLFDKPNAAQTIELTAKLPLGDGGKKAAFKNDPIQSAPLHLHPIHVCYL